jgi:NAD(P)-dependent dehydrogenase (short-subunit alcohol dehydrogenase family)
MELTDKNCLVVGGSGAIGAAVARMFLSEGARVMLTLRSRSRAPTHSRENKILRACETCCLVDVRDRRQVARVVRQTVNAFGALDVVVNCTGVLGPIGPIHKLCVQRWTENIEINLLGSFNLIHAALPLMLHQNHGKIICFSGGGAAYGRPFFTAYSAAKAALVRLIESVAAEVRDSGVDINAIAPGPVKSRLWEQLRRARNGAGKRALEELKQMERTGGVSPDRAASLALFLASERSNGLTGRLISCVHDKWSTFESQIAALRESDAGMLRRVPFEGEGL